MKNEFSSKLTSLEKPSKKSQPKLILFFDSHCVLCSWMFRFWKKRDRGHFRYASIHSSEYEHLIKNHPHQLALESILLKESILTEKANQEEIVYQKSEALLRIMVTLNFPWKLFGVIKIIPPLLLNRIYDFIAKRRRLWFNPKSCTVPRKNSPTSQDQSSS